MQKLAQAITALAVLILVPAVAWAQVDTGAINVRAVDADGAPLPGVQVTLSGPQAEQVKFTGADGTTRFPALRPGTYATTLRLEGFRNVRREGLEVSAGQNVSITATLELAEVEETITVTGESPVVDVKSTDVASVYDDQLMDKTPTASGLWAGVLDHVPGVVQDTYDVGGADSGQQSTFSSRGSPSSQNTYLVNGADTTDPDALGASSTYFSTPSFDEVQVSTGAHDLEMQNPGVVLNVVTKSGTNEFHGGARAFFEDESFVSENIDQDLRARGANQSPGLDKLEDYDLQVGGPIVPNRAWFFVDYWDFSTDTGRVGLPEGTFDDTALENWTLRGSVQVNEDLKVSTSYLTNRKFRGHRPQDAFQFTPVESMWIQDSFADIPQVQGQYVVGQDGFLDVRFSKMDMEFPLERRPEAPDTPPTLDLATGQWSGPPLLEIFFQRDRSQTNATYSHFLQSEDQTHDLKVGFEHTRAKSFEPFFIEDGVRQFTANGSPFLVQLFNTPAASDIFAVEQPDGNIANMKEYALFAQDTWTFGSHLTVTGGVRWDKSEGWLEQQNRPDSFFTQFGPNFQAASFPEQEEVTDWSKVEPRIGVVYDVMGDGRWAVKANYARFSNTQPLSFPGFVNRNGIGNQTFFWNDNGDGVFQLGEQGGLISQDFPGSNSAVADDFQSPVTEEFTIGLDHELMNDVSVSVIGIFREAQNLVDTIDTGVAFDPETGAPSFQRVTVTDPGPDGQVGTADDGGAFDLFEQVDNFGEDFNVLFNPDLRGLRMRQDYRAVEFTFHKRWSENWQALSSWTIQEAEGTVDGSSGAGLDQGFGGGLFNEPNGLINADGPFGWSRTFVFKATGNYLVTEPIVPELWAFNVGVFYRHQSGVPFARTFFTDQLAQGDVTVNAERRGDRRLPDVDLLDFRAEKQFTLPYRYGGTIHVFFDWFNILNDASVTGVQNLSGDNFDTVTDFIAPRTFRIGAQWEF